MKKILNVVGARPNFMKIAPLMERMQATPGLNPLLIHTGQHYDEKMSKIFFEQLEIPRPQVDLGVGSGSHAEQTAAVMVRFEKLCLEEQPDLVLVVGDVNSTAACSLVAAKLCIPVAHVEAGLRSRDRSMPEEINRIVTDALSTFLFTTSRDADENLMNEGVSADKIFFVGNVMIDTLLKHKMKAGESGILRNLGLSNGAGVAEYAAMTLHRPSNVDDPQTLAGILDALKVVQDKLPIIFPVHPRTRKQIEAFGFGARLKEMPALHLIEPLGYLDFLALVSSARIVLTDSGGLQEETTVLGVPCLTLRPNTERPVTITEGTNILVGTDAQRIVDEAMAIIENRGKRGGIPEYWDGQAAARIVDVLVEKLG
jgi:UDP-N-acetylglucosamine 2-epimerase (non-hydrolysing)